MSAGSALGGLAYGSRRWHAPLLRQFGAMLAIMGLGLLPLALPWSQMTEAFTWSTSALLAGVGLGMALGGVLAQCWGSPAAFAAAGAAALVAAAGAMQLAQA